MYGLYPSSKLLEFTKKKKSNTSRKMGMIPSTDIKCGVTPSELDALQISAVFLVQIFNTLQ